MSRVGKMPISIPSGVEVKIENKTVTVKGPKGLLEVGYNDGINVNIEEKSIVVTRDSDVKEIRAYHGLTRALINNAVLGVTQGFK